MKKYFRGKFIGGLSEVGIKFTGKSVGKVLGKFTFGILDVGFGVWDIVDGVGAIKEGHSQSKEFRKAAKKMVEVKNEVNDMFNNIKTRCDDSNKKVTADTF